MTPERWERLKTIFHRAVALDSDARARFLSEKCADDPVLREEVEGLLSAYPEVGGSFAKEPRPLGALPAEQVLTIGHVLDAKYRIEAVIGRGGMGVVYRARHIGLDSPRALKVMRRELAADQAFLKRFVNEARLAAGLQHSNLVSLYDFAQLSDGSWYIVSELVEGETIASQLKRGVTFSPTAVADLMGQAADGLAYAHRRGIIHRDVSPENLMITVDSDGNRIVKVLDFGIAKAVQAELSATATATSGLFIGKVGYASPEQIARLTHTEPHDPRADVFSLAVVTYRMLTRKFPFAATGLPDYVYDAVVRPEEEIRKQFGADLPRAWVEPLSRALRRHRDQRTPSMEVFRSDMEQAVRASAAAEEETITIHRLSEAPTMVPRKKRATQKAAVARAPTLRRQATPRVRSLSRARWIGLTLGVVALAGVGILLLLLRAPAEEPRAQLSAPQELVPVRIAETAPEPVQEVGPNEPAREKTFVRPSSEPTTPPRPSPRQIAKPVVTPGVESTGGVRTAESSPLRPPVKEVKEVKEVEASPLATLTLDSTPRASVFIDGEPRGTVPATLKVSPGNHRIALITQDGVRWEKSVSLRSGEALAFSPRLDAFGDLSVVSETWAEVSVDGGTSRQTPWVFRRLLSGTHRLRAGRPGYKEQTIDVVIEEGKTTAIIIKLEKLR